MKITIDIPDNYVNRLSTWASIGRTLREARRLIDESMPVMIDEQEAFFACIQELDDITPALEALHYYARQQIWIESK